MQESYITDVFTRHIPVWRTLLASFVDKPDVQALEVGSFEGRSACWLLTHVLTHPTSHLTCIDLFTPFHFYPHAESSEQFEPVTLDISAQFDRNIEATGSQHKLTKLKGNSPLLLRPLPLLHYDIIYIDGSHEPRVVLQDIMLAWPLLKEGGIFILDDYGLKEPHFPEREPKVAIDAFLQTFSNDYELLHKDFQVIVRKTRVDRPESVTLFEVPLTHPPR